MVRDSCTLPIDKGNHQQSRKNIIQFTSTLAPFLLLTALSLLVVRPWGQFPLNDEWVYTKNILSTFEAGRLTISAGQWAYAIPQILLGAVLIDTGEDLFSQLRWIGIISGIVSSLSASCLCLIALQNESRNQARRQEEPPRFGFSRYLFHPVERLLCFIGSVSTFFFFPSFQTSMSFMTDMPSFLLWILSLWTLGTYLTRRDWLTWIIALSTSAVAVSQRQLAIAIPVAAILANAAQLRHRLSWEALGAVMRSSLPIAVFLVPLMAIQLLWNRLSPVKTAPFDFSFNQNFFIRLFIFWNYLGLLAVPFCFFRRPSWKNLTPASKRIFLWSLAVPVYGFFLLAGPYLVASQNLPLPPYLGNLLSEYGVLSDPFFGFSERIFPDWFRILLLMAGCWGGAEIIKGFAIVWDEPGKSGTTSVIIISSALYLCFLCCKSTNYDRYAIPLIPFCLLCLFKLCEDQPKISITRTVGSILPVVLYISFSVTLVSDYFRRNEAQWQAINHALSQGIRKENLWAAGEYLGWFDLLPAWDKQKNVTHWVKPSNATGKDVIKVFPYHSFWGKSQKEMLLLRDP